MRINVDKSRAILLLLTLTAQTTAKYAHRQRQISRCFPSERKAIIFRTLVETLIISTATKGYTGDIKEAGEKGRKMAEEAEEREKIKKILS